MGDPILSKEKSLFTRIMMENVARIKDDTNFKSPTT